MPDNIYGEAFLAARGGPAWHRLGEVYDDPNMTAVEGIEKAGIDYEYMSAPVGYEIPGVGFVQDDDRVAILRGPSKKDDSWERLGVVSGSYRYLQNRELAEGIDRIREATGWRLETVGALGKGETVFMTLYTGTRTVKGDEVENFFLVADGKAARRSLGISSTHVRTVCKNTLQAAEKAASTQVKLPHHGNVEADYRMWTEIVPELEKLGANTFAELEQMANVRISRKQAERIIAAAYPEPKASHKTLAANVILELESGVVSNETLASLGKAKSAHEAELDRILARREAVLGRYDQLNDNIEGLPNHVIGGIAGTAYMALQAVTETLDWGESLRGKTSDQGSIFGNKRIQKGLAWTAAKTVAASRN